MSYFYNMPFDQLQGEQWQSEILWRLAELARIPPFPVKWPTAAEVQPELLAQELAVLPQERCLATNGDLAVYLLRAEECPEVLQELGRLREITFRRAGEGTGKARDLDRFDRYYHHMVVWNCERRELVGAYRVGSAAKIIARHGVRGLYTSTLFNFDSRLFEKMGPALELGRSFVR